MKTINNIFKSFNLIVLSFTWFIIILLFASFLSCSSLKFSESKIGNLINFHKVDEGLYRSAQPNCDDMIELEKFGIKSVINLRHLRNDKNEAKNTQLKLYHIPINTWFINYSEVVKSLKVINQAQKPVLVHCLHGSDRTGCIVAAYQMAFNNYSKKQAIEELKNGGFGYHEKIFPNIIELLESIDIEQLKKDVEK